MKTPLKVLITENSPTDFRIHVHRHPLRGLNGHGPCATTSKGLKATYDKGKGATGRAAMESAPAVPCANFPAALNSPERWRGWVWMD